MGNLTGRSIVSLLFVALIAGALPPAVSAAVITIPAITFTARGTAQGGFAKGFLSSGGDLDEVYTAPAYLPAGDLVCRFEAWVRDNDGDFDVTVRLRRKIIFEGDDGAGFGAGPGTLATVTSTGGSMDTVRLEDVTINVPRVSNGYLYWVEIVFPGGNIDVLAVRITTATSC